MKFEGVITALITPFKSDLSIDYTALNRLIENQIENKVDALVIAGSTGEGHALSHSEKIELIGRSVDTAAGRIPIIAGTGTNYTAESVELTLAAEKAGAEAVLLVAPYYNKPTQRGLYEHYKAIADCSPIPNIIYNIPGRSGINISAATQVRLAEDCENIKATKEASGNFEQIMQVINYAPEGFSVLSGDDALTLPMIFMGAKGVISVLSNFYGAKLKQMVTEGLKGNVAEARKLHYELMELMQICFIETNPIPIKAIMSLLGYCEEVYRLPLTPLSEDNRELLISAMVDNEIIEYND
ncbi:MAG: 4-hydroxy-tetrahydrodipicolinate synthase [bacterium]